VDIGAPQTARQSQDGKLDMLCSHGCIIDPEAHNASYFAVAHFVLWDCFLAVVTRITLWAWLGTLVCITSL
jgi:hypothetical protein